MDTKTNDIIDRIRKLLALSTSSNEHEAAAAAAMASRLMAEHRLNQAMLDATTLAETSTCAEAPLWVLRRSKSRTERSNKMGYTEYRSRTYTPANLHYFSKGCFQTSILHGVEAVSCSTLRGKAAEYRSSYQRSVANLIERLRNAGVPVAIETRSRGRKVLVIG